MISPMPGENKERKKYQEFYPVSGLNWVMNHQLKGYLVRD